jgi:hypothetical protein
MTSSITHPDPRPAAVAATVDDVRLSLILADGRQLIVPIAWFGWLEGCPGSAALRFRDH